MPFRRYKHPQPVSASDLNARADALEQVSRYVDGSFGVEGRAAQAETLLPFQVKITGVSFNVSTDTSSTNTTPNPPTRPTYRWQLVNEVNQQGFFPGATDNPYFSGGLQNQILNWPAYERTNNPNVPVDGSIIVNVYAGLAGAYLVFDCPREFVIARLTGKTRYSNGQLVPSSGYSWYELQPGVGSPSTWNQFPPKNGGLLGGINNKVEITGIIALGNALVNLVTDGGGVDVATTIANGGSSYPPSSTFNLRINGGGGTNGEIQVTTSAGGVVTSIDSIVTPGTGYADTVNCPVLGPFNVISVTNGAENNFALFEKLFVGQLIFSTTDPNLIQLNTVISDLILTTTNGFIFLSKVAKGTIGDTFAVGGNTGQAFPLKGEAISSFDTNTNFKISRGFCSGYPAVTVTNLQDATGVVSQKQSIVLSNVYSGNWSLIFDSDPTGGTAQTTIPLLFSCNAATVQTALRNASSDTNVTPQITVTGSGAVVTAPDATYTNATDPFIVTIAGGINYPPLIPLYQGTLGNDQQWIFDADCCNGLNFVWGIPEAQYPKNGKATRDAPASLYYLNNIRSTTDWGDVEITVSDDQLVANPSRTATIHSVTLPVDPPIGQILEGEGTGSIRMRSKGGNYKIAVSSIRDRQWLWVDQSRNSQEFIKARDDVLLLVFNQSNEIIERQLTGYISASVTVTSSDGTAYVPGTGSISATVTVTPGNTGLVNCPGCPNSSSAICLSVDSGEVNLQIFCGIFDFGTPHVTPTGCGWGYEVYNNGNINSPFIYTYYLIYNSNPFHTSFPTMGYYVYLQSSGVGGTAIQAVWQLPANWCPGNSAVAEQLTPSSGFSLDVFVSQGPCFGIPTVTALSPSSGPFGGGTAVTITGTNFTGATAVNFGTHPAVSYAISSDSQILAVSPPNFVGVVNVTVSNMVGISATTVADLFTYYATSYPTVTAVTPVYGSITGGLTVVVTGSVFIGTTAVFFGATQSPYFEVDNDGQLIAVTPAHAAGTVHVTVVNPGGTSATSPADEFSFLEGPFIYNVAPASGPTTGGTSVTITGFNFTGVTSVTFDGTISDFTFVSDTEITAISPPHSVEVIDIQVTTGIGTSPVVLEDQFSYGATSTITLVDPNTGPIVGGTTVVITGTGFTGATDVEFGSVPTNTFTVDSDTQITAVSPAQSAGTVDIRVTVDNITSDVTSDDQFTYIDPPVVYYPTTVSGPTAGGNIVVIYGLNFTDATEVLFGATSATFTVIDDGVIEATAPAHAAGLAVLTVTTPYGTSADEAGYTYMDAPTVASVSPDTGIQSGGTVVVITGTGFEDVSSVRFTYSDLSYVEPVTYTVDSSTQITATTAAGTIGLTDVIVTTPGGMSDVSAADEFTYTPLVVALNKLNFVRTSSQYIDFGNPAIFQITGPLSVSVWFLTTTTSFQAIVSKRSDNAAITPIGGWMLEVVGANVRFSLKNSGGGSSNIFTSILTNTLHHCVATWDGTTGANGMKLYLNGSLAIQGTSAVTISNTPANLLVGTYEGTTAKTNFLGGTADALRYYNTNITPTNITELFGGGLGLATAGGASANLVGWWGFDEASGNVIDLSGNGNTGILTNGPVRSAASILG